MMGSSMLGSGFFNDPVAAAIGVAMTMRGKKAVAMLPKKRPDFFGVGWRDGQAGDLLWRKKGERTFRMRRRHGLKTRFNLEQEHEPMRLPLVTVFGNQGGKMQVRGNKFHAHFFKGFAAGAGVGRLTDVRA